MRVEEFQFQPGEPLPELVIAYGREFKLVGNSRWQMAYQHEQHVFILSKISYGLFDLSYFDKFTPADLEMMEKSRAAISINTAPESEKQRIPQAWLDFAQDFCTNPPPEVYAIRPEDQRAE